MIGKLALVLLVAFLGWCYQAIQPPPPKICGSANGPPVTSQRVRLSDGRHLAYKESGVPKDKATYKIVVAHGWMGSKASTIPASKELVEELGVYFLSFDRAGYGESDPYPGRSVKSEAFDIEQLADGLRLGDRFYVLGVSMGGYPVYACLKYIPHRLAGAALIVPVINYWWPSLPSNLSKEAFERQRVSDQWMFRISHYAPSLLNWWMTQKWFVSSDILAGNPEVYGPHDRQIIERINNSKSKVDRRMATQQGEFESLYRDMMVGFGNWGFDPLDLDNPFPDGKASVHMWQGYEDRLVPCSLQRYVAKNLPWIKYHEIPHGGHLFVLAEEYSNLITRVLLLGEALLHKPETIS